jgi:hypothetical protein
VFKNGSVLPQIGLGYDQWHFALPSEAPMRLHTIVLRRHPIVLVPEIFARVMLSGVLMVAIATIAHTPLVIWLLLIASLLMIAYQILVWHLFTITISYDRIWVHQLSSGRRTETSYAVSSLPGLTLHQSLFGMMLDCGTLVLPLSSQSLRFTLLTPYSLLKNTLGW